MDIEKIEGDNYFMIKRKGNFCIFFDRKSSRCNIYNDRPIDCQLFPFTLEVINKKICITFNRKCIKDKKSINEGVINETVELIKKFPKKERIKYALYNLHDQKNEEGYLKEFSTNR